MNSSYSSLPHEEHNLMKNKQVVERAKGSYIWMEGESDPYIDFVMGYSAANFGHLNDDLIRAFSDVAADNIVFFSSRDKENLIQELGRTLGLQKDWSFYFPVGGAMAVEAAARACLLSKPGGALLSFKGAFHGYGGVSRALTDEAFLREDAFTSAVRVIRNSRPCDAGTVEAALAELDTNLSKYKVAGVFIEPVQGAAGFIDLGAEFLHGVRGLCAKHNVPLVVDEIQSAMYRCGALTVSLQRSVTPDILLLGKSLGGGIAPISAVIMSEAFSQKVPTDRAAFDSTFSGWSVGVAAARRVIGLINQIDFAQVATEKGNCIDDILDDELDSSSLRTRFRRIGMAVAYDGANAEEAEAIRRRALEFRVIVQTSGIDGSKCKLSPAITISPKDLEHGIRVFCQAVKTIAAAESDKIAATSQQETISSLKNSVTSGLSHTDLSLPRS